MIDDLKYIKDDKDMDEKEMKVDITTLEDNNAKHKHFEILSKVYNRLEEIEKELDSTRGFAPDEPSNRRKRRGELLRSCTEAEKSQDYNDIRGLSFSIKVGNNTIKIGNLKFKKNETVKADLYGEIINVTIKQIQNDSIKLKTKNNKKVQITIGNLESGNVKLFKTSQR